MAWIRAWFRVARLIATVWIPAFAGMTGVMAFMGGRFAPNLAYAKAALARGAPSS